MPQLKLSDGTHTPRMTLWDGSRLAPLQMAGLLLVPEGIRIQYSLPLEVVAREEFSPNSPALCTSHRVLESLPNLTGSGTRVVGRGKSGQYFPSSFLQCQWDSTE